MNRFFESGLAIDLMLAVVAVEAAWLAMRGHRALVTALLPGVFLMLGLRAALTGQGWQWIALWLTLSLPAHVWDMRRRVGRD